MKKNFFGIFLILVMSFFVGCPSPSTDSTKETVLGHLPGAPDFKKELLGNFRKTWEKRGMSYRPRTRHLNPDGSPKFTNRLFLESSPYLLQHAHNPVNWYPWGDEAFEAAKKLKRPVLLSVGYSTCHWCHVMEEESFEDEEIARFLNENYIAIKVDREERPDIDAIYMTAVQAMTGSGGWPMTVFLTPGRKPFFGGTYFPARDGDRGAGMGFLTLLRRSKDLFDRDPDRVTEVSEEITQMIQASLSSKDSSKGLPTEKILDQAFALYSSRFDSLHGGLIGAPKFPSSLPIRFLLRYGQRAKDEKAIEMANFTLEKMAAGGMYDHVGGGFHRYSTDRSWLVPHFEKMLYDNALLATTYLEAFQMSGNEKFAKTAQEILKYVSRDMRSPQGAFYSATDADSLKPDGEKDEGYFFTWTPEELVQILGKEKGRIVSSYFGASPSGNFEGRNILHAAKSIEEVAKEFKLPAKKIQEIVEGSKDLLYLERLKRPQPLRDEKILTAWNGLMISAFARASRILNDETYLEKAVSAADFILSHMRKGGRLFRSYLDGKASHDAYLDDYAFLIGAMLDLYEATSHIKWIKEAILLDQVLEELYEDPKTGGFFMTPHDHEELLAREKPSYDGAEPSGNSVQTLNLLRMYELTSKKAYRKRAEKTMRSLGDKLSTSPQVLSEMLLALDFYLGKPKEIVIVTPSSRKDAGPFLQELRSIFLPNHVLAVISQGDDLQSQSTIIPIVEGKTAKNGKATAYVCENRVCQLPTTDAAVFLKQIQPSQP